jgi:hypothetical protein
MTQPRRRGGFDDRRTNARILTDRFGTGANIAVVYSYRRSHPSIRSSFLREFRCAGPKLCSDAGAAASAAPRVENLRMTSQPTTSWRKLTTPQSLGPQVRAIEVAGEIWLGPSWMLARRQARAPGIAPHVHEFGAIGPACAKERRCEQLR